jgi:2-dehydro-3-deoxyphosphogluconate aldolase / (4S)-4-hydroxy-2-oxoglutarate aldolase
MTVEPLQSATVAPGAAVLAAATRRRVIPVVTIDNADHADPLADALIAGGLPVIEVTLRTPAALAAMAAVSSRRDILVGAGSVRTVADVDRAIDAGAQFLVSPGIRADIVDRCRDRGIALLPGAATPTDLMTALALGITTVKLFPASLIGGPAGVSALAAPFPDLSFVPTGGITAGDAHLYLAHPQVIAVGGGWIAPGACLNDRDWAAITEFALSAVTAATTS